MRIVWLGESETATFRGSAASIVGDGRVSEFALHALDGSVDVIADEASAADGVVLAVHHFEPLTSGWLARLNQTLDASRWRIALGPFAAVAARAPFDLLHRQAFLTSVGPLAIRRWLDLLSGAGSTSIESRPSRVLIWEPSNERSGIDRRIFSTGPVNAANDVACITPRTFGLPFSPDVTVAWITADLNREERVHLGQVRSATPGSRWVAVYATPAAAQRFPVKADATLVWPFDVADLRLAAAGFPLGGAISPPLDRAA